MSYIKLGMPFLCGAGPSNPACLIIHPYNVRSSIELKPRIRRQSFEDVGGPNQHISRGKLMTMLQHIQCNLYL